MGEEQADPSQWLRPHEVAERWGVHRSRISRIAEEHHVKVQQLPAAAGRERGERRYHPGDVARALREMQGEAVVTDAARRLTASWAEGRSIWDVDPGTADRSWEEEVLSVGPEPAPDHVAGKLGIQPGGEVIVRRRRYRIDGRLVLLAVAHLPVELAADTPMAEADSGPGGIWKRLAEIGHPPTTAPETVSSRGATDYEAARLEIEPGSPVMEITRVASTAEGRAVDVSELTAVPGYFRHYGIDLQDAT